MPLMDNEKLDHEIDWPEGKGLGVPCDLIPAKDGISWAVRQRITDRFYLGNDQHGEKDKYWTDGEPVHDFPTYLEKAGRHLATAMADWQVEDHLAAAVCDLILAMQHQARKTDRPKEAKT